MGKRGPRKEPSALQAAKGNPSKRPVNDLEPKGDPVRPRRPWGMTKDAAKCWTSLMHKLKKLGVLSRTDTDMLVTYCETWARWHAARRWLDQHGVKYPVFEKGDPGVDERGQPRERRVIGWRPWPEVAIEQQCRRDLRQLGAEFGLSPSSRTGLTTNDLDDDGDDLSDFNRRNPALNSVS